MESVSLQITWYSLDSISPFLLSFASLLLGHVWPHQNMCWSSSGWVLAMSKTGGVRLAGQGSPEDTQSWCPGSSSGISFQQSTGTNPKVGSVKYNRLWFEPKNSKNRILGRNHFIVHISYYGMFGSSAFFPPFMENSWCPSDKREVEYGDTWGWRWAQMRVSWRRPSPDT